MTTYTLYFLFEEDTGNVFYIGVTKRDLRVRLTTISGAARLNFELQDSGDTNITLLGSSARCVNKREKLELRLCFIFLHLWTYGKRSVNIFPGAATSGFSWLTVLWEEKSSSSISMCARGKAGHAGGFIWRY